jgi:hypothetical protein
MDEDDAEAKERLKRLVIAMCALVVVGGLIYYLFLAPSGPSRLAVYSTEGIVQHKGQPVAGAFLEFHPEGDDKTYRPRATTSSDGTFKLTTYEPDDGAPVGSYRVTVYCPLTQSEKSEEQKIQMNPAFLAKKPFQVGRTMPVQGSAKGNAGLPDRFEDKYTRPERTTLKAEIKSGTNKLDAFILE